MMAERGLATGVIFAAAVAPAFAGGGESLATEPSVQTAPGIRGEVVFKNFSHFEETSTDHRKVRDEGILKMEWTREFTQSTGIKLVGDARADDGDLTQGVTFRIPDTAPRRSHLNLVEAVIRLRNDATELTLGKQIYVGNYPATVIGRRRLQPCGQHQPVRLPRPDRPREAGCLLRRPQRDTRAHQLHAGRHPGLHPEPCAPPVEPVGAVAAGRGRRRPAIAVDELREHPVRGQSPYDIPRLGYRAELLRRVQ